MPLFRKTSGASASDQMDAAMAAYKEALEGHDPAATAAAYARLEAADSRYQRDVIRGELDGILFDREAGQ